MTAKAELGQGALTDAQIEMFRRNVKTRFAGMLVDEVCDQAKHFTALRAQIDKAAEGMPARPHHWIEMFANEFVVEEADYDALRAVCEAALVRAGELEARMKVIIKSSSIEPESARDEIEACVIQIRMVCDTVNLDPNEWLVDEFDAATLAAENADLKAQHMELIMAVARKWPNETRHQTALRYINERESRPSDNVGAIAARSQPARGADETAAQQEQAPLGAIESDRSETAGYRPPPPVDAAASDAGAHLNEDK